MTYLCWCLIFRDRQTVKLLLCQKNTLTKEFIVNLLFGHEIACKQFFNSWTMHKVSEINLLDYD